MKGGEMPSPPDVILVLSPRMAKLVRSPSSGSPSGSGCMDFDEAEEFADTGEAEDAAERARRRDRRTAFR
jgi:hypothetical protein